MPDPRRSSRTSPDLLGAPQPGQGGTGEALKEVSSNASMVPTSAALSSPRRLFSQRSRT
jgi:hypothetical protein